MAPCKRGEVTHSILDISPSPGKVGLRCHVANRSEMEGKPLEELSVEVGHNVRIFEGLEGVAPLRTPPGVTQASSMGPERRRSPDLLGHGEGEGQHRSRLPVDSAF